MSIIATTLLFVLFVIDLTSQTYIPLLGPPKLHTVNARLKNGHLLARKLLEQKAYLMSKRKIVSALANSGKNIPFPVGVGPFTKNTMALPQQMASGQTYATLPGGINSAATAHGVDDSLMTTLDRDLFRVVNSLPNVVSVTVGSPDSFGVNDRVNNNNIWRGTANGEIFGDNIGAASHMGGTANGEIFGDINIGAASHMGGNGGHVTSRDMIFSPESSSVDLSFDSRNSAMDIGVADSFGADSFANRLVFDNNGFNGDNFNNTVGNIATEAGVLVKSSVDNGVKVFQKTFNTLGNFIQMGLPDLPAIDAGLTGEPNSQNIDIVGLNPTTIRNPNIDILQPDRGNVGIQVDGQSPDPKIVELSSKGVDVTDGLVTGLLDIQSADMKRNGIDLNSATNNIGHAFTSGPSFMKEKSNNPKSQIVQTPKSLVPEVLLSFDNAYVLIPATGKSRDIISQSGASADNNSHDGTIHGPHVSVTTGLQTLTDMDLSGSIKGSNGQIRSYDPFSARLKPEAFGPGPYYECAPPAQVVCGARFGWDHVTGMTDWCKGNCIVFNYSSYCDDDRCQCECVTSGETVVR